MNERLVAVETEMKGLRELLNERDERYQQQHVASQTAILKAEASVDKRLEGLNELRQMTNDQAKMFMRSAEAGLAFKAIETRIDTLENLVVERNSKGIGMANMLGYVVGILGLVAAYYFHR